MKPYFTDGQTTLYHGQSLDVLREMPAESVNCIVTSPPYFGLRDYGVDGQIGAESSPDEFVAALVAVFREARRVLSDDGTLWLNLGDSFASSSSNNGGYPAKSTLAGFTSVDTKGRRANDATEARRIEPGVAAKNLLGIPWRTAFALQDDGWILRNDIIWAKPNGMPESVTDRLSTKDEHLFLFSKSPRYWFDLDPIREPLVYPAGAPQLDWSRDSKECDVPGQSMRQHRTSRPGKGGGTNLQPTGRQHRTPDTNGGRNPGDVWTIPTQPFSEAHFAVFPAEIPRRCIAAGCKPGGVVLDPFSGSGTTGLAAAQLGRRYVGIDLNAKYLELSLRTRLAQPSLTAESEPA